MSAQDWTIVGVLLAALIAVAAFLAVKVVEHGEGIAELKAGFKGLERRLDRQDQILDDVDGKLERVLIRLGVSHRSEAPHERRG